VYRREIADKRSKVLQDNNKEGNGNYMQPANGKIKEQVGNDRSCSCLH